MTARAGCQDNTDKLPASLSGPIDGLPKPRPGLGPPKGWKADGEPGITRACPHCPRSNAVLENVVGGRSWPQQSMACAGNWVSSLINKPSLVGYGNSCGTCAGAISTLIKQTQLELLAGPATLIPHIRHRNDIEQGSSFGIESRVEPEGSGRLSEAYNASKVAGASFRRHKNRIYRVDEAQVRLHPCVSAISQLVASRTKITKTKRDAPRFPLIWLGLRWR
ncbi:hypothetical protein BT67DRAFT_82779 [Trichocladium antarcticum]|uniref:Uncharacterized protein n=1 Tax=Trichocladium antarcticum TaxID=1450529 RepID=A0AAN6ZCQ1_9PEZI|nr:hypothetical protein BT67DRAFT_82779 [Trichocladium antarcticum]